MIIKNRKQRTRFAPTPSGELHLGNLYNFLLIQTWASENQAEIFLRLDHFDTERNNPISSEELKKRMMDYGFKWVSECTDQTQKKDYYWRQLAQCQTYACDCTRSTLLKRTGRLVYDGFCRKRDLSFIHGKHQLRFRLPLSAPAELKLAMGDFVLWRKEDIPSYQWVSYCDDRDYEMTTVIRGSDLLLSTLAQMEMAKHVEENLFLQTEFIHHRLLMSRGAKLSKSTQATPLPSDPRVGWRELARYLEIEPMDNIKNYLELGFQYLLGNQS